MNHLKRHLCGWSTNTLAVNPSATCALGLPSTQVGSPRLGRPSARWLRPVARPAGVVGPVPRLGSQAPGVRSPSDTRVLQAAALPQAPTKQCSSQ